jgi:ABC-type spermidine/putrescine transport system permease subunit II
VKRPLATLAAHAVLLAYTALALFPVLLVAFNSVKERLAIFRTPYALPTPETFSLIGYDTVLSGANFPLYFRNSLTVTLVSLALILLVSSMAAFALSEYRFSGNALLGLYLALGIMIPIRLGTVSLLRMMVSLGFTDTLLALILVYTASGIPLAVFILTQFMSQVPRDLKDAARIDGASEYRIYGLVLPLVRPALERPLVPADPSLVRKHQNRDPGRADLSGAVRERLERGAGLADAGSRTGDRPLRRLFAAADPGVDLGVGEVGRSVYCGGYGRVFQGRTRLFSDASRTTNFCSYQQKVA